MTFTIGDIRNLNTVWPLPTQKKQIVLIGAGGIVRDAHLPAYKKGGYQVRGIYDPLIEKANECATAFNINKVYRSMNEAINETDTVLDIAVPPSVLLSIVKELPKNSICQLQKPLGKNLNEAGQLVDIIESGILREFCSRLISRYFNF